MAEVNVDRRSTNLGQYVGGLVLLGVVVWGLVQLLERDAVRPPAAPVAVAPVEPAPLTELSAVVAARDRRPLVGRRVQLGDVAVQSVAGDHAFWVGPSVAQRMLVVLDEALPPSAGTARQPDVDVGQRVAVSGVVRQLPAELTSWRARLGLDDVGLAALRRAGIYLAADRVAAGGGPGEGDAAKGDAVRGVR